MKILHVYEVFELVEKAKTKKEKISVLQKNGIWPVKDILKGTYDETIQWNLPEGKPPYVPNEPQSVPSTFLKRNKDLKYFVKGGPGDKLTNFKREKMFLGMLESVHPADAELLCNMIDKRKLGYTITKSLVKEAFPDLIVK